jgi:hypothetical protein
MSFIRNRNRDINIFSTTEWSNQETWNYTLKYCDLNLYLATRLLDNNKFNILLPHWGFENEKYVRTRIQLDAKALLTGENQNYSKFQDFLRRKYNKVILPDPAHKWDLIFAHHPHVLQPIMNVPDIIADENGRPILNCKGETINYNKLAVFSAGNFTSGAWILRRKKHVSGIIMKCEIGSLRGFEDKLVIGKMEWRRTKNYKIRIDKVRTKRVCVDSGKYRTYNLTFFVSGIVYAIVVLILIYINTLLQ